MRKTSTELQVERLETREVLSTLAIPRPTSSGLVALRNLALTATAAESNAVVARWNQLALNLIRANRTAPPIAARQLAILHIAMFDAINGLTKEYAPILVSGGPLSGNAASVPGFRAAHDVLAKFYPQNLDRIHVQYFKDLSQHSVEKARFHCVMWGKEVAEKVLAARANDGSATPGSYLVQNTPGRWVPTPPAFANPLLPAWGQVKTFALTNGQQFRPGGPPALTSAAYAAGFNEVKRFGSKTSTVRTADQTQIATFWADGAGTFTPPGHWNAIAQDFVGHDQLSITKAARVFALLNMALADSGIAAWDAKYAYNLWRPVTAIRNAHLDNNASTSRLSSWEPLLTTPPFPEYVSGHSTFSSAAATVLGAFFGANVGFITKSNDGQSARTFRNFAHAAQEAGQSRIYGGIHFQSGNQDGLTLGKNIGLEVLRKYRV